jgi:hypothetical protein
VRLSRRGFIATSLVALSGAAVAAKLWRAQPDGTLLSAFEDAVGDQYVGGVTLSDGVVFGARVPMRAHGCAIDPRNARRAVFFARRPGTQAFELALDGMQVRTLFETGPGRHLSGHGVFSRDGTLLYTPEHDYEHMRGVIAVRESERFSIVHEFDSGGIDPHEVVLLDAGRTLVVANGGIMTHPRSYRRKLNLDTMDPSLCLLRADAGEHFAQWRLPDHRLSIRHLALAGDSIVTGLQYEGDIAATPGIVALHRRDRDLSLLAAPPSEMSRCKGYVASVAISEAQDLIAAACPYGNGIACWSLSSERYLGFVTADEPYGLSRLADGDIAASQRDGRAFELHGSRPASHFLKIARKTAIRWDDHWVAAA